MEQAERKSRLLTEMVVVRLSCVVVARGSGRMAFGSTEHKWTRGTTARAFRNYVAVASSALPRAVHV